MILPNRVEFIIYLMPGLTGAICQLSLELMRYILKQGDCYHLCCGKSRESKYNLIIEANTSKPGTLPPLSSAL